MRRFRSLHVESTLSDERGHPTFAEQTSTCVKESRPSALTSLSAAGPGRPASSPARPRVSRHTLRVSTGLLALLVSTLSCAEEPIDAVVMDPAASPSGDGSPGGQAAVVSSDRATSIGGATATSSGVGGTEVSGTSLGGSTGAGDTTAGAITTGLPTGSASNSGGQVATGGMSSSSDGQEATGVSMGSGGSIGTAGAPSTCSSSDWAAGDQTITLMHDGVEREYEVHVPPGYTGTTAVPLMLVIHGAHNTPGMVKSWSQMNPVADENGFVIAYPAGLDCWNSGVILPGCTAADDDVGFLLAVVSDVQSHACIDPKRVYAAGISNGSIMAQFMGCESADVFAAVAGVAGGVGGGCSPSRPISVFYVHGTEDSTVSYSSARPNVTGWADRNGCDSTPMETYNMGSTVCETYGNCDEGVEVVFCTVSGMGHCWPEDTNCGPGGGPSFGVTDFKASPMFWEFFERHPLP